MAQNDHVTERKTVRMIFTKTYNELTKEFEESEPNKIQQTAREKEQCECSVCSSASNNKKGNLKLPKIELKKFNGEIKEWLGFWGQFSRIHEDPQIKPEDKFQYLIQATVKGTRARDIVEGFPATSENYDELYDQLEAYLRALESIGMTKERYAANLYPMVESCLSEDMIRVWLRSTFSKLDIASDTETYKIKLEQLLAFLKSEVEGEERIHLAKLGFGNESNRKSDRIWKEEMPVPTASHLYSGESIKRNLNCVFFQKGHESRDCFNAQKMTLGEKRAILNQKRVCYLCFKSGHRHKYCKAPVRCVVCGKRHSSLMCTELSINKEEKREEINTVAIVVLKK
ncbi:uncharacterized protein [Halyomorpha halys]|uniref:uncharacterized protein n=1 Tax=Halyomorpha halys TaxID=286706 RepID=UPI0034D1C611